MSMWQTKYDATTAIYTVLAKINLVRRREKIATAPMTVHAVTRSYLVLSRDTALSEEVQQDQSKDAWHGVWLFVNNDNGAANRDSPRRYCSSTLPPAAPEGWCWQDELSGEIANFMDGCLHARDGPTSRS